MRFPAPFHLLKGYFSKLTPEGKQMCSEISIHTRPGEVLCVWCRNQRGGFGSEQSLGIIPTWSRARRGHSRAPWGAVSSHRDHDSLVGVWGWKACFLTRLSPQETLWQMHRQMWCLPVSFFLEQMRLIANISFLCCGDVSSSWASVPWKSNHSFPWNIRSFSDERLW